VKSLGKRRIAELEKSRGGEGSDTPAILANLDGAIGGEFLETSLQFSGEIHAEKYKENN
jgi:hypothetical protein